jgi:hypothetical protein
MLTTKRLLKISALCALSSGIALSCSLDRRKLHGSSYAGYWILGGAPDGGHADGGMGGMSDASEGGAGHPSGGSAAQAGTGSTEPSVIDGCPDLDFNGKGDCTETLVKNPNFADDTQDWTPDSDAFLEWSPQNHFADLPSGSAQVSLTGIIDADGYSLHAATQCVPDAKGNKVKIFANLFAQSGQGDGRPSISLFFFSSTDCSGELSGAPLDVVGSASDVWQTVSIEQALPEGTRSALVRLAVTKSNRSQSFKALFDNLLIRIAQ